MRAGRSSICSRAADEASRQWCPAMCVCLSRRADVVLSPFHFQQSFWRIGVGQHGFTSLTSLPFLECCGFFARHRSTFSRMESCKPVQRHTPKRLVSQCAWYAPSEQQQEGLIVKLSRGGVQSRYRLLEQDALTLRSVIQVLDGRKYPLELRGH